MQYGFLNEYRIAIENALESLLNSNSEFDFFEKAELANSIRYSVLGGGKRIRAILSLISSEAIQKTKIPTPLNPAYGLALALELIHAGSLIHDDLPCMDNDDLRRGKPSNHKKFGEATALLSGDALLVYPIQVLIKQTPKQYQSNIQLAVQELIEAINGMIAGQALDLANNDNDSCDYKTLQLIHKLKTGAILRASVRISAILTGANQEQITVLTKFAEDLGLAFQIMDDILDQVSNTEALGKTVGKDKDQNKLTYLKFHSVSEATELANQLIKESKKNIQQINIYTDKLNLVADYVVSRTN